MDMDMDDYWSQSCEARLAEEFKAGVSLGALSSLFLHTSDGVCRKLSRMNLIRATSDGCWFKTKNIGQPAPKCAEAFAVSEDFPKFDWANYRGRVNWVKALFIDGRSVHYIARHLRAAPEAVVDVLYKAGLIEEPVLNSRTETRRYADPRPNCMTMRKPAALDTEGKQSDATLKLEWVAPAGMDTERQSYKVLKEVGEQMLVARLGLSHDGSARNFAIQGAAADFFKGSVYEPGYYDLSVFNKSDESVLIATKDGLSVKSFSINQPKELQMSNIKITTKTYIGTIDASTLKDEQIYTLIAEKELEIKQWQAVQRRPKKLDKLIAEAEDDIQKLCDLVDSR